MSGWDARVCGVCVVSGFVCMYVLWCVRLCVCILHMYGIEIVQKYVQNMFAALSLLWLIFCVACVVEIVD